MNVEPVGWILVTEILGIGVEILVGWWRNIVPLKDFPKACSRHFSNNQSPSGIPRLESGFDRLWVSNHG